MFNWLFGPTRTEQILANIRARGPLTELVFWVTPPPNPPIDAVGRPTIAHWYAIEPLLWPRPDPSKRWRLFIQEDTRP